MSTGQRNASIHQAGIEKLIKVMNTHKQFTMVSEFLNINVVDNNYVIR